MIVNPGQSAGPKPPVTWAPDAFARLPVRRFRVLNFPTGMGMVEEEEMKLNMFFLLFDVMILLAYPFIFIASKMRRFFHFKG